ncbi:MAG: hypothetical protein ACKV2O_24885 [Acidimicrobiales bacterium]
MATFLVMVHSNPVEGREEEFNQWYEHVHLDEVLRSAGFRSAQRFQLDAQVGFASSHRYLAMYETEGESAQEVIDRLNASRDQRQQSKAIDNRGAALWVFSPTGERHELPA